MSSLVGAPADPRSTVARTLVLGALVAVLAVGVLSMHGLTAAGAPALTGPESAHAAHAESRGAPDHERDHDGLGHLGAICLWLAISGALLLAVSDRGRRWARRRRTGNSCLPPCVAALVRRFSERAPPPVLLGQLRC